MTSDYNQDKVRVAIDWINKLAQGTNPIDGSILPDSDIVNNVHISRCLFFVSDLLNNIDNITASAKRHKMEFQLTPEAAEKVYISERSNISMFVKEINRVSPDNMKRLSASQVTQWLVSAGYLEEQERNDGLRYKAPTELGKSIGISSEWTDSAQGWKYLAIYYDANAQHFILENLFKL